MAAARRKDGSPRRSSTPSSRSRRPWDSSCCTIPGSCRCPATLNQDQSLDAARDADLQGARRRREEPADATEEVDRVTTQMLRGLENSLSNAQAIATGALNTAIAQGDWRLMFLQHDRLKDVTPADVVRVAKTYFKPSNRTVGYYIPDAAPDRTVVPAGAGSRTRRCATTRARSPSRAASRSIRRSRTSRARRPLEARRTA